MRPGYLGDLEDCWFGDEIFEIQEARSAQPIYALRDRIRGRTGEEIKAFLNRSGWSSLLIPKQTRMSRSPYPYKNSRHPSRFNRFLRDHRQRSQVFKLV